MAGSAEDMCGVWGGGRLVWALHVPKVILRLGYKVKYRCSTPAVLGKSGRDRIPDIVVGKAMR